jgi:SAM-dependent methyltransferase
MPPDDIQRIRDHADLPAQLAAARARISELEAMGIHLAADVARLRDELDAANRAAIQLADKSERHAAKVARMRASASWKVTTPLRALRRMFFDGKHTSPVAPALREDAITSPERTPSEPTADPGPTIAARSDYKRVWDRQSVDADSAKRAVAGYTDEAELLRTARRTEEVLVMTAGLRAEDVILEIGCGVGRVGSVLATRCRHWIGTDISGNMIAHARERMAALPNVTLVELSTVGLSEIPDTSVDLVYCTVVFMHLYEWDRWHYVKEAFRVLRPGGRCYFDNMAIGSEHGWQMFLAGAAWPLDRRPAHLSMISSGEELEAYAKHAGFENVRVHRLDEGWVAATGNKP